MNNSLSILALLTFIGLMLSSGTGLAEGGVTSNDIYNPREEIEYSYQATLERQEERNRQIQFQKYQQQQYLEQQRQEIEKDMYNQIYQKKSQ